MPPPTYVYFVFLLGVGAGAAINWAIYSLAYNSRPISPWSRPHPEAPPRRWFDYLPVVGWWTLRRESPIHGRGFWIRPLLLELSAGIGMAALCWWEIDQQGLLPPLVMAPPAMLWRQFTAHFVLIALLAATTFIDFDEKYVPDAIILPGTLLGLLAAALTPASLLPIPLAAPPGVATLLFTSPNAWSPWLDGPRGLAIGAACMAGWCLALLPRLWTTRRGLVKAVQFFFARMFRGADWWVLLLIMLGGWIVIFTTWSVGGANWRALLTSLVGMAGGGLLVWGVRFVGGVALGKEAMGFGDVTLLAMIGAYLGWQSAVVTFFLSPFAALFIAVAQWAITGRKDIAFVPYLSLAAVFVIVGWRNIWDAAGPIFSMGWLIPGMIFACLVLMGGLLSLWRIFREAVFGEE